MSAAGYSAPGYMPGVITLGPVTNVSRVTGALSLAGQGDFATFGSGSFFNTGGALNLTKGSLGVVNFTGSNPNWTSGTVTLSTGVLRTNGLTSLGPGTSLVINNGLFESRLDAGGTLRTNLTNSGLVALGATLYFDHSIGGSATDRDERILGIITRM